MILNNKQRFDVLEKKKWIDEMSYFSQSERPVTEEEVRKDLIDDGYPQNISVKEVK